MNPRPAPRARTRARRVAALVAVLAIAAIVVVLGSRRPAGVVGPSALPSAIAVGPSGPGSPPSSTAGSPPASASPQASDSPAGGGVGFASLATIRDRATLAASGAQPAKTAVDDLLNWARSNLDYEARPKERLNIGGTTGSFVDDTAAAYGLALAWAVTSEPEFAQVSRDVVMAWVTTTTSLKNACPDRGDCQTSLIVSRNAPGFIFAVDLLDGSAVLSPDDRAAFDTWLRTLILPAASIRTNNWGDAGAFLRAAATAHLGDAAGWDAAIAFWRRQLDLVAPDGSIPEEVRRGSSGLSYTQEALMYKVAVARLAELRGVDLWSAVGSNGGSLREAVDFAANAMHDPASWPDGRVDRPEAAPLWELVQEHWPEPAFAELVREGRPFGWDGHSAVRWTTLTDGVALGP